MDQSRNRLTYTFVTGAFLIASYLCGGQALAQHTQDPRAERVDALYAGLNRTPSPGLAVVVVRDGKIILRRGYGLASIEHRVPITPATVFDVASLSKQFTGLAVAMLVSDGKIKLTDDIRKYIPELPSFGRPITIEHLLHHTSGLRDWPGTLSVAGWKYEDVITFRQILTMAYNQQTLNFEPGAEHLYSNTGYNLLAEMVQRVTGQSFRAWTDAHIFRPLGMVNTHFRDDYTEVIANRAFGYARAADGNYRSTPDNLTALGSSSLFSTADDIARWLINFDEAAVGGRAAVALMQTRGALNDGTPVRYAFGILLGSYRGLPMFTHSGGWASFDTYDVYFPQQKFGIVALANSNSIDAQSVVIKIANIYLEKELAPESPSPEATPAARIPNLPPAVLEAYEGLYRLRPGSYVRVKREGGTLTAQTTRGNPATMLPRSEREFRLEPEGTTVVFQRDADGKVVSMEYDGEPARKVDASNSRPPAQLADYAGEYYSEELDTFYRVVVKNGELEIHHPRRGGFPLAWLWREEFGSPATYLSSVEFHRDGAGHVTGLIINGDPRSRDIRFVKRR
ncbi:MAG TPA: serine hydrolase [Pyrinomonadaceae bacterium]|jgi:CubicO group peptidase (beta-lactamase class C family)